MDNMILLDYLRWADEAIFTLVRALDGQYLTEEVAERSGTIHDRLLHLAEEYLIWLYDVQDRDHTQAVEQYRHASTHELMATIDNLHNTWHNYVATTERTDFTIKESDDMAMNVSLDEVIFNLVNHSSYHRGQIMTLLRVFDVEVPITDFYWYLILKRGIIQSPT